MNEARNFTEVSNFTSSEEEAIKALDEIINQTQLSKGYQPFAVETQKLAVAAWFEVLNTEQIPFFRYRELYRRAAQFRAKIIASDGLAPLMSPELLLAQWSGLKKEIEQSDTEDFIGLREVIRKCPKCFGSGFERVRRGRYWGVIRCAHAENSKNYAGEEIVGVDEGIEIIKLALAERGLEFNPEASEL